MSGFKALNIESDDESDIEVDDTKEIQIEEALKLYQAALKYHAEGPDSFDRAAEAYKQLFESDIFKYPESQTELQRIELYGPGPDDGLLLEDLVQKGTKPVANNFDTGPSTLPQILHLSHKNYAQFKLDALSAQFDVLNAGMSQILVEATAALKHFVEALDKDDTDLDLWRRTASVGKMLDSKRAARYCLESVLDGDEENLGAVMSLPGLEEGFAGEELRELVGQLQDQLSYLQSPLSVSKRRTFSKLLKQRLHPYDGLLQRVTTLRDREASSEEPSRERTVLKAPVTWTELGDTILRQRLTEQHGTFSVRPGTGIAFDTSGIVPPAPEPAELSLSPQVIIPRVHILKETRFPTNLDQQFPGTDRGKPTVQPQIASADASMEVASASPTDADVEMADSPTLVSLPSRKRSGDAAGLGEGEEGRTKSKRIRARDSNAHADTANDRQAMIDANLQWEYEQQLKEFQGADDWMFDTTSSFFNKVGVTGFDAARHVRGEMQSKAESSLSTDANLDPSMQALRHARLDIQGLLDNWNDQMAQLLLRGGESLDIGQGDSFSGAGGMFASGGTSKAAVKLDVLPNDGLPKLLEEINADWLLIEDVAWRFVEALLRPGSFDPAHNSYINYLWPETLKTMMVRTLVNFDETIFAKASGELESWKTSYTNDRSASSLNALADLVESIFELHLDIFCLIKQPNSGIEPDIVIYQGDRLQRWSELAREAMQFRNEIDESSTLEDTLATRFLWATTFHISASDLPQDHVIECMKDLRAILVSIGEPTIQLQNNAIMPELSVAALDRELSKLTTKDFFLKVTNQDMSDPAGVIESLEPLLESLDTAKAGADGSPGVGDSVVGVPEVAPELVRFLESSPISVRLLLWQRLREAYVKIEYDPMVICCYLRMIGMVLEELKSPSVVDLQPSERLITEVKSLRLILEMVKKMYEKVQSSRAALDCIDGEYLKFAVSNFGEILQLLQVFNVAEDSLRVGKSMPPTGSNGLPVPSFKSVLNLTHDAQVRVWTMLYWLLQEGISQNKELYPTPLEDRFDFLRTVHRSLGIRGICNSLNRAFVRMLKEEFFQMTHVHGYDSEQAQVLYDLHGLNCFVDPSYELIEHHCTRDAFLDKSAAMQCVDLLLAQANKLSIKDLIKHPLKDTIEKVHGSLSRKRPTEAILRNREIYRGFLKSPINPLDLYACLKGEGNQLAATSIPDGDAMLASKGWYFLMGHMALTKYRAQKRSVPTPTEDVDIAVAFFMQDLEFTMDHWETWFRLAQAYDSKIEESVIWSAEKLNNNMSDLVTLQKNAIHCFAMATALAHRSADLQFETSSKMADLYADFAQRLYSSSRDPFSMKPFEMEDTEIFVSGHGRIEKRLPTKPLRVYTAWKLANVLFKRALAGKSDQWQLHYMVGKCLWKMHNADERTLQHDRPPTGQEVLDAFVKALELLPEKDRKESKDSKREPTLEPHYKLLTIVHKLYTKSSITIGQAKDALQHTHYARRETFPDNMDEWAAYVVAVLKHLRAADKSNWYHRMIVRHAMIVYKDMDSRAEAISDAGALAAKEVLTQQMFTKTMVLQVWRPENERGGRHFVYTTRYTRLFVRILKQLQDRASLEQLARRVRRRPNDFFEHTSTWQDICGAYLQLLRSYATVQEGLETSTFSNIAHEDFLARKDGLEKWMQEQPIGSSAALDVLRDVQELKKINSGMMKPAAIDDLIGDAYAHLFSTVGKQLWEEDMKMKKEGEANKAPAPTPLASPSRHPMMSLTHLMNLDGSTESSIATTETTVAVKEKDRELEAVPAARRKVGVGRREIRAAAENCFLRAGLQSVNAVKPAANAAPSKSNVQSLIEQERACGSTAAAAAATTAVITSAPGSVHDDADDESELSELEEEDAGEDADDEEGDGEVDGEEDMGKAEMSSFAAANDGGRELKDDQQQQPLSFPALNAADQEDGGDDDGAEEEDDEEEQDGKDGGLSSAGEDTEMENVDIEGDADGTVG
jgi:hypothetical protein